jgi:hypothetical protein
MPEGIVACHGRSIELTPKLPWFLRVRLVCKADWFAIASRQCTHIHKNYAVSIAPSANFTSLKSTFVCAKEICRAIRSYELPTKSKASATVRPRQVAFRDGFQTNRRNLPQCHNHRWTDARCDLRFMALLSYYAAASMHDLSRVRG